MPKDAPVTKPVLIHVDPDDWKEFQEICGRYRVSRRIRAIVRREIRKAKAVAQ